MTGADTHPDPAFPSPAVVDVARSHATDRYLAALLAPAHAQGDLVILAAYAGELMRVPLLVREAAIGEIRLAWWRDTLSVPGSATGNPVADAVAELAARRGLSRDLLLAPIEGISRELYEDGVRDAHELAHYADETQGSLLRLALGVLGGRTPGATSADAAIDTAARALAFTRLALTLPQHLAHGRLPLPPGYVGAADPRASDAAAARDAARAIVEALAREASAELSAFRAGQGRLARDKRAAFLPLALVAPYLAVAVKPGRDVLTDVADLSPLSRIGRLWFAYLRGRV
jgi:phytoene synthase